MRTAQRPRGEAALAKPTSHAAAAVMWGVAIVTAILVVSLAGGCGNFSVAKSRADLRGLAYHEYIVRARGVPDADIDELERFRYLRVLNLCSGWGRFPLRLTSDGMHRLAVVAPSTIDTITICDAIQVDDQFLRALARMTTVHRVVLRACPTFGVEGLEAVASLPRLTYLDIRGCTQVNDSWLAILMRHEELTFLGVAGTSLSANAIEELRSALPACRVDSDEHAWAQTAKTYRITYQD